jgi:hypothetical protein
MAQAPANRVKRVPVEGNNRNRLTVDGKDPGYEYRWVNDLDSRIELFKEGGWETVTHKVQVGDKRVGEPTQEASAVTKAVGKGTVAVLMRILKEWYDEDQLAKMDRIREVQAGIEQTPQRPGMYGKIKIGDGN